MDGERDERETQVVHLLRNAIAFAAALGALVIALSFVDIKIIDLQYRTHSERAGSNELVVVVLAALLPAGWVYRRPRWPQIVVWVMWLTSWYLLIAISSIGRAPYESADPGLVRPLIVFSLALMVVDVAIVMPLIRCMHKSPPLPRLPRIPQARVVR